MGQVKKQFSAAAKPRCSHHAKNFMPANDFEAHTGLSGISGHYTFPRGLSATKYQDYLEYTGKVFDHYTFNKDDTFAKKSEPDPALMEKLRKDWDELVALNPVLKKVSVNKNDGFELHDALYGVVSKFNTDDINIFLDTPRKTGKRTVALDVPKIYGLKNVKIEIELTAGSPMYWVPSPTTIQKIKAALKGTDGNHFYRSKAALGY